MSTHLNSYGQFGVFWQWAKQHKALAIVAVLASLFGSGVSQFVSGVASVYGASFVGDYKSFKHSVATYAVIDAMLRGYLAKYNASRICVARFHNDVGDHSMVYVDFESIITATGVAADIEQLQNLPATTFSEVLPKLLNGQTVFIWTSELPEGPQKELGTKRAVKAVLYVPMTDLADELIGMITVVWLSPGDVPNAAQRQEMARELTKASSRIGAYVVGRRR